MAFPSAANSPQLAERLLKLGLSDEPLVLWLDPKPSTVIDGKPLPPNFTWVTGDVAVSGTPRRGEELISADELGIRLVLTLHEKPLGPGEHTWVQGPLTFGMRQPDDLLSAAQLRGTRFEHLQVPDGQSPRPEQLARAVELIRSAVREGRKVLVHCQSGVGRSGTVAACWLCVSEGLPAEVAVERLCAMKRPLWPFALNQAQTEGLLSFVEAERRNGGQL
eukprot:TRINITY_DN62234_c0_g1_i1.p2 TRINITY_DN62234_c0_g1~~TRINITY_DN62234_c0_g1_i1.p2  ORF type:complete len:220 (+),score=27.17 TRINITY_DN62234_c0_g1_i1:67-726(+)